MSVIDFVQMCEDVMKDNPRWRRGQTYFNVLYYIKPELANSIRGTSIDCFHNDKVIPDFLSFFEESQK